VSDASYNDDSDRVIGSDLSEEDRTVLRLWRKFHERMDGRYNDEGLLRLVARSLADADFRTRVLNEVGSVPVGPESGRQEGLEFIFLENTQRKLYVILPPPADELGDQYHTLGQVLRSRTSAQDSAASVDDIDLIDDEVDPPIVKRPIPIPGVDDGGRDDALA
jgi:hypothetical protein